MAAAAASRKRAAPNDDPCPAAAGDGKKRARYNFSSIYDYDKLEVLGEGAYGVVMRARHRRTGQEVAVKWIRDIRVGDDDIRAVVREAGCLTACRGATSVVQIRDVAASAEGDLFIITELVDGGTLRDQLNLTVTCRFTERRARDAMRQLLRGVESVHAAPAIHRDIKPDNVLVGRGGALKICDFGLATPSRLPFPEEDPSRVGTMWYRAPELVMGCRSYGTPVDMWALGCVMFELLTGQLLFADVETEDDLLSGMLHLRDEMEADGIAALKGLPSDLSQAAGEFLCGLLCFDEDKRLTAAQGLKHRWFAEEAAEDDARSDLIKCCSCR
ncbi:hypothetical protein BS78_01G160800 [Paspalum vaginatum]|nr:hypothetical protein BS78_01G160800 [Paspalum vaginatum]